MVEKPDLAWYWKKGPNLPHPSTDQEAGLVSEVLEQVTPLGCKSRDR